MTVQELYERMGGSYANAKTTMMMDKIIDKMIRKLPGDKSFEKLSTSWEARDAAGVFDGAHALKGVCANLGLMKISEQASALAEEFRSTNPRTMDDAEVTRRVEAIRADYAKAVEEIQAYAAQ